MGYKSLLHKNIDGYVSMLNRLGRSRRLTLTLYAFMFLFVPSAHPADAAPRYCDPQTLPSIVEAPKLGPSSPTADCFYIVGARARLGCYDKVNGRADASESGQAFFSSNDENNSANQAAHSAAESTTCQKSPAVRSGVTSAGQPLRQAAIYQAASAGRRSFCHHPTSCRDPYGRTQTRGRAHRHRRVRHWPVD